MDGLGLGGVFLQIGGAVSSAIGSYYSAQTSKINSESRAVLADVNAKIAELGAQSTLQQGQQQIGALTLSAGRLKSQQRTSMAANGIDLGTGNAAEVLASTEVMKGIDANTLKANAMRSAWGQRTQAANYQSEAATARATASATNPGAMLFSTLLNNAGTVASSWYQYKKGT